MTSTKLGATLLTNSGANAGAGPPRRTSAGSVGNFSTVTAPGGSDASTAPDCADWPQPVAVAITVAATKGSSRIRTVLDLATWSIVLTPRSRRTGMIIYHPNVARCGAWAGDGPTHAPG